jgi:hypothetical protein
LKNRGKFYEWQMEDSYNKLSCKHVPKPKFDHIKGCELNAHQTFYQNQYWKMCDGANALKHAFLK